MKVVKIICLGLLVSFFAISCKDASQSKKETVEKSVQGESLKKIEVGIEGMTCQIGCAKTIESKLSKLEGVSSVAVSFEDKLGKIVYDENKISKEEISKEITAIAGGETYTVSTITEVKGSCCAKGSKGSAEKCATAKADCKTKCQNKKEACCSEDLKECTMKCDASCTKKDCAKCTAVQDECKKKCATEKQACCKTKAKTCKKKCSDSCTKKDCDKCDKATLECKKKCEAKK